ncbi:hypothetical protein AB0I77_17075 [Streptomyces sp. NPDC050619]|uniref:hypothetical protein n=1 Tax=Streptomyces sp. NPDC050619 TaxID=3157214 RepID=UPI00342D3D95
MAVLAVIIPFLMLGVVLALGRYEEVMLPQKPEPGPADLPDDRKPMPRRRFRAP